MKLLLFVAVALVSVVAGQDSFGLPDKLLADVNPGPDSSYPGTWYLVGGKAYTTVTITGKTFLQILVSDGTSEGTRLVGDINTSQRGDPFATDPFWTGDDNSKGMEFATFDGKLWITMYNYATSEYSVWTIDPTDDVLQKYEGGIIKSVGDNFKDELNIQNVGIFKDEYFALNPTESEQGLYIFDKAFSTSVAFSNASNFNLPNVAAPFYGFDYTSTLFLLTEDCIIIQGRVKNYEGLWAYDGTAVWPLNLGTSTFHDSLKVYDSVHKKLYYIAFFNELPQVVVNDLNDLSSNFTILTNLDQECFPLYDCFSYLGVMDEQKGTVAFAYNTQLGFTNGTPSGTKFLLGNPRAYTVLGAHNGKLYFREWVGNSGGSMMVTNGTLVSTRTVLEQSVGKFIPFNGNVLLDTGAGMFRIDQNEEITFIRDISISNVWAIVTLSNNNQQLYTYFKDIQPCGRGCSRTIFTIQVSDGTGIVSFSDNFQVTTVIQPVFVNDKFLMRSTSPNTGYEVFYMDAAPESYNTPPPIPETTPSVGATSGAGVSKASPIYLLLLTAFLFML